MSPFYRFLLHSPDCDASKKFMPLYAKSFLLWMHHSLWAALLFIFFFIPRDIQAQDSGTVFSDTTFVDTVIMKNADSLIEAGNDTGSSSIGFHPPHIYDTSQYFFNTKMFAADSFSKEKIAQRGLIGEEVNRYKSAKDFWYIPAIEKLETRMKNDPRFRDSLLAAKNKQLNISDFDASGLAGWINNVTWFFIIIIFTGAIIYFLLQNKISIFSGRSAKGNSEVMENPEEGLFHLSYNKLIQQYENENNYRDSIRLMFLQTLKLLSDANCILYRPEFTNLNYVQQLQDTKFYQEFISVVHNYEYTWYGKFNISAGRYAILKKDFMQFQNKIT